MNPAALSMAWVVVALLACRPAAAAEEWRITNWQPVSGAWTISEVKFFADDACSKQLAVVQGSAYVSPLHRHIVPSPEPLARNATEDCWGRCGPKPSGLCDWCGRGNACCRARFPLDPPECHYPMTPTSKDQHRCVKLLPSGRKMAEVRTDGAFDGHYETAFSVNCEQDVCPPGSLVLGVSIAKSAAVRCVLVTEPQPPRGRDPYGRRIWLERARRPAQMCPGVCRSGRHLECGSENVCRRRNSTGVCTQHLSPAGTCGSEAAERAGVDCTGCRTVPNIWEAVPMPVADPSSDGLLVPVQMMHKRQKFVFTAMRERMPAKALPKKLRGAPKPIPKPLLVGAGDCWVPCQGRGGFCSYCGTGRACCRQGFQADPEECKHAVNLSADLHQCVTIAAEHQGAECLQHCDGKGGMCSWCGAGGACCKRFAGSDPPECKGAMGFLTHGKQHECVRVPVPHEGKDCWGPCGSKSGSCHFCGAGNACCKAGAQVRLPHSEGGEDLDAPECRFATGFVKTHHECVRLAHSEHNGSVAVGADGRAEVVLDPTPSVVHKAAPLEALAAHSEQEVQVHYQAHDEEVHVHYEVHDGSHAKAPTEAGAFGASASSTSWSPSQGVPFWILACALSALLGSLLTVACVVLLAGRQLGWRPSEPASADQLRLQSQDPTHWRTGWPRLLRSASKEFGKKCSHHKGNGHSL